MRGIVAILTLMVRGGAHCGGSKWPKMGVLVRFYRRQDRFSDPIFGAVTKIVIFRPKSPLFSDFFHGEWMLG